MFHPNAEMIQALVEAKQYKPLFIEEMAIEVPNRLTGWRGTIASLFDVTSVVQK